MTFYRGAVPHLIDMLREGRIVNEGRMCDALTGPCACGTTHMLSEVKRRLEVNDLHFKPKRPTLRLVRGGGE